MFAVCYLAVRWLLVLGVESQPSLALRTWTAAVAGGLVKLFGVRVVLSGISIVAGDSTTTISGPCLPISSLSVGLALVLSSTALRPMWKALWGAITVAVVLLANVLRIAIVALLASQHSPLLDPVHEHVLPIVTVLVAIAVWALAERVSGGDRRSRPRDAELSPVDTGGEQVA